MPIQYGTETTYIQNEIIHFVKLSKFELFTHYAITTTIYLIYKL